MSKNQGAFNFPLSLEGIFNEYNTINIHVIERGEMSNAKYCEKFINPPPPPNYRLYCSQFLILLKKINI